MVVVHFFVASKVARYRAFSSAVSLGNTLLFWFNFRYVESRDSMALIVYMTFRTSAENLKIGEIESQLSFQRFMEFEYFGVHFSVTLSRAARAFVISNLNGKDFLFSFRIDSQDHICR